MSQTHNLWVPFPDSIRGFILPCKHVTDTYYFGMQRELESDYE